MQHHTEVHGARYPEHLQQMVGRRREFNRDMQMATPVWGNEALRRTRSPWARARLPPIALIDGAAVIEPILRHLALPTDSPAPHRFITAETDGQSIVSRSVSKRTRPM
jgi:hypothetical protein